MLLYYILLLAIPVCYTNRIRRQQDDYSCPARKGLFADPLTCKRFYQCVDNHPYRTICPPGLYFDDVEKYCTFKNKARCGPLPTTEAPSTTPDPYQATKCDLRTCSLPYCYCSKDGTRIPKDFSREKTPQMVMLTFDDAVNEQNIDYYREIFNGSLLNPNECPIKGTFLLSHEYTDYQIVQELYHQGHEIAVHTITHRHKLENANYSTWADELIGMREILYKWANVSRDDILGGRAPFLKPGRNAQYQVMSDFDFVWDSSLTVPVVKVPIWPYTLDYMVPHECRSGTCPTSSFPGIWEIPLNTHHVSDFDGGHCNYLDQCVLHNHDPLDVYNWLKEDFERHYLQNKAPYMLPFHTSWFQLKPLRLGLYKFLRYLVSLKDVWFVTMTQSLLWITDPQPVELLHRFEQWDCTKQQKRPKPCLHEYANKCPLDHRKGNEKFASTRYLTTCGECPTVFPWIGDTSGFGVQDDVYIPPSQNLPPVEEADVTTTQ